ncbi:sugar phosphate isomerase/epimerase [Telluribacter sp.]|jgi:sugar phosphate isomerase/epimerase|uniref:sugar phosphate isomerase/epimerase family protein n=1 Tax=Telluribacter sp. TaxID=1978767 RepID=UPI002E117606|nr:sugar phosphate isomerase/epimerase [Telluribacter sp.]
MQDFPTRRSFLKASLLLSGMSFSRTYAKGDLGLLVKSPVRLSAHIWVYASKYPPDWNCTPILEQVFSEIKAAGFSGIELMNILLEPDDAVTRISALIRRHGLPVTGCSYGAAMWKADQQEEIVANATKILDRLQQLGGTNFGVSVGDARRKKTSEELDAQAAVLKKLIPIAKSRGIILNLHNHTYEVEHGMHDLKGTLDRVPHLKLGPDLNWLIRGGVDPIAFIQTYGDRIVYMHLRDQKATGKWAEALGEGTTDFGAIAKVLKKMNCRGEAAVELAFDEPNQRTPAENWQISRRYVKEVFGW